MRVVDLFCGGGGFSLGAHQAGLEVVTAIDIDPLLTGSFHLNFPGTRLMHADLANVTGADIVGTVQTRIDGIFGGPPCQGFSDIGRRDGDDPRRRLILEFFRLVAEVSPRFFVMENVRGLAYSGARSILDEGLSLVAGQYEVSGPIILDASEFGAATARRRLFVIGVHRSEALQIDSADFEILRAPATTVAEAIRDLEGAIFEQEDADGYDVWTLSEKRQPSRYAAGLRSPDLRITGHRRTVHSDKVTERFAAVAPGGVDPIGRHPRLSWEGLCPTLRAGTGTDRGSYQSVRPIHPTEPRVITVREAARLQGFPDSFRFHPTTWHSFRMIGNSVSPVMAEAIFSLIRCKLQGSCETSSAVKAAE